MAYLALKCETYIDDVAHPTEHDQRHVPEHVYRKGKFNIFELIWTSGDISVVNEGLLSELKQPSHIQGTQDEDNGYVDEEVAIVGAGIPSSLIVKQVE